MDETGLYWRRMPNGGLSTDGYAVVATNATGSDRLPLWLIGTAKTPRALREVNFKAIGCTWRWNKKAWMRSGIMKEWLDSFYKHIGKQRRVLLLLDNFSAHLCALEDTPPPPNIRVLFFPANATSIYQPLDQGIIQNLKHHYRRKWMLWMNCFDKSTITGRTSQIEGQPEVLQLDDLYQSLTSKLSGSAQEIMPLDNFLDPSDENNVDKLDLSDIILDITASGDGDGDDENDEYIFGPPPDLPSSAAVIYGMKDALLWAQHQEGTTEENIRQIEGLIGIFTRLQVDRREQKTLEETWL
ncbi:DDE-domain-containing protein [Penicillium citrinum]|uniref:DDE-domain-containing protein n=1 Tax=Penicillium citrinum TaxID=5077 RepID=A0A9W9TT78_PENCI|nr:DDE-domain-containing protein [Penicillium citrinum]KAJ5240486.1 DDE-domain-containing protein [Penicillium citrinum]